MSLFQPDLLSAPAPAVVAYFVELRSGEMAQSGQQLYRWHTDASKMPWLVGTPY
jgi:hypothetical protein